MNYLTQRNHTDDMLKKNHWQVFQKLLVFGEDPIKEVEYLISELEDFGMNEPDFIVPNVLLLTSEWLTDRYITLRSEDLFPEDFQFVVDISVEEAIAIRENHPDNYEFVEDYYTTVADIYSYGGYGVLNEMSLMKRAVLSGSNKDVELRFIEEDIAACIVEILIKKGWFIVWELENGTEIINEPFQSIW